MKKILFFVFSFFVFLPSVVFGVNTFSGSFVADSTQYLSISNASQVGLDISSDMTMEAWIWIASPLAEDEGRIIFQKTDSYNDGYLLEIYNNPGGAEAIVGLVGDGTNSRVFSAEYDFIEETWIHVAASITNVNQPEAIVYINASPLTTIMSGSGTGIATSTSDFLIASNSGAGFWDGFIDEARIWSDIRSGTEISDYYMTELNGDEANLEGYWKMNDDNFIDYSVNFNNLTNNNTVLFSTNIPFPITPPPENISSFLDVSIDNFISRYKTALILIGIGLLCVPFTVGLKDVILKLYRYVRRYFNV